MKTLFLRYDLDSLTFIGGHIEGKWLDGLASVALGTGSVSLRDREGRDLLADPAKADESSPDHTKAQLDVAQAFGFTDPAQQS